MTVSQEGYNLFDKALHHCAFKTVKLQLKIALYETEKYQVKKQKISLNNPVFITSLPRAGTSILLNVLTNTEHFSFQTYQDMPFIFLPLIWDEFSRKFGKKATQVERAHKDGLEISLHSPEAFEEAFFKAFWPQHYDKAKIPIWDTNHNLAYDEFFKSHIQKLIFRDKHKGHLNRTRYISKNNLNITRVSYLSQLFPTATILIPFREPLQHAMSLLLQHLNFTQHHVNDEFSKKYMTDIGHFDFGQNLKTVNFTNGSDKSEYREDTLNFWLEYWIETYSYLISNKTENCIFFNFDLLCQSPMTSLNHLADCLYLEPKTLLKSESIIKKIKTHDIKLKLVNKELIDRSHRLQNKLLTLSVN
ncbi:sulfotransferase [Colwellia sp. C1TZA3]|uniref:sulfotransferase n=1 Tax=Colwellia sp. C1TZA3 TaxID=2508879 RepID=UPI0011B9A18A|nr:sulfotransferase [Colwellia sp. C1TZA3]TWX63305.1 sulfotransferase [Colwellia sp. C1TZA3]